MLKIIGGTFYMRAVVEIKGGFGNQIFQYAFANHLKNEGYKVTININENNIHGIYLNSKNFGFKESSKLEISLYNILDFFSNMKLLNIFSSKLFLKESNFWSFLNTKIHYLNYFDGYWQNIDLIKNQKEYLIESLIKTKAFDDNLNNNIQPGKTLVHVRRGDYIDVEENLNINFYEEAIRHCKNTVKNFSFEIFTDDVAWVNEQNIFDQAKAVHGPTQNWDELLNTITKMFNFENYIVGNSTFSLVPSILTKSKNPLIIVADPWMKYSNRDLNIDKSWVKIKNS